MFLKLENFDFEFVSDFGFRVSDLAFTMLRLNFSMRIKDFVKS